MKKMKKLFLCRFNFSRYFQKLSADKLYIKLLITR